jgi:hypothetical protein
LTGDAQALGHAIQRIDHPHWEVDVHPTNFPMGTSSAFDVNRVEDVDLAIVEGLVELMRLHTEPPLVVAPGVPLLDKVPRPLESLMGKMYLSGT